MEFICNTEEDTVRLGQKLSSIAKKGDVFALYGTLGMGKSVFSRAFVKSLTSANEVPSPTFTLVQVYEAKDFDIYHFDLYRLKSPEEIFEIGMEEALYDGVCLIEWPEKMQGYLPKNIFRLEITPYEQGRKIKIETTDAYKKLRLQELND
jgi:tRNA threonylcarbamoyl adenosine modification protein YjeE